MKTYSKTHHERPPRDAEHIPAAMPTVLQTDEGPESEPTFRVWTDVQGRCIEAVLLDHFTDHTIALETRCGKTPTVPLAQFSNHDQDYVRQARPEPTVVGRPTSHSPEVAASEPMFRIWTDRRGRTVEAALIALHQDRMTLQKRSGAKPIVPLAEFCAADQAFVRQQTGLPKTEEARSPAARISSHSRRRHGRVVARDDKEALTEHTEVGLGLGRELMDWWTTHALEVKTVPLQAKGRNLVDMQAFFETMESSIGSVSVMGCIQKARFPFQHDESVLGPLDTFLKTNYAIHATWPYSTGHPAGFGYDGLLYKEKESGNVVPFEKGTSLAALDLTQVDSAFEWITLRVDIHDFLRATPMKPLAGWLSRFVKEAAYVVCHQAFGASVEESPPGTVAECSFGYAFLPCPCVSGPFGFGPGHFKAALKLFRFSLLESGELEIKLTFIVSPRSTKVLNLWGFDPIYATLHLLDAFTLGLLRIKNVGHLALDKNFMTVHGRVHHDFLCGMEDFWSGKRRLGDHE